MGLLVHTQFETLEGLTIANVYCRLHRVIYQLISPTEYLITFEPETYVSREKRLQKKLPLRTPGIPGAISVTGVYGDMTYLYGLLKSHLETQGFTVDDVLEPPPEEPVVMDVSGASLQSSESTQPTLCTNAEPE